MTTLFLAATVIATAFITAGIYLSQKHHDEARTLPEVVYLKLRPSPTQFGQLAAVYDGKDSIFLIGLTAGYRVGFPDATILKFDIHAEKFQEIGRIPTLQTGPGSAVYNPDDSTIYYFGDEGRVGLINLSNNSESDGISISYGGTECAYTLRVLKGMWDPVGKKAYFLGSQGRRGYNSDVELWSFDPYKIKSSLNRIHTFCCTNDIGMIQDKEDGLIYLFGNVLPERSGSMFQQFESRIAVIDPVTGVENHTGIELPRFLRSAHLGWNQKKGLVYLVKDAGSDFRWVMTVKPRTGETMVYKVDHIDRICNLIRSVYVPKMNRMYYFGECVVYVDLP